MINAIIIDDEHDALEELKLLITTHCKNIQLIGEGNSVKEAINLIDTLKPAVVFLDIEMPTSNGFNLLEHYKEYSFSVIFTTAFDQYAIKAIRFCALDYLLKPIQSNELINAVDRVVKKKNTSDQLKELSNSHVTGENNTLILNSQNEFFSKKINDIVRFEADRNYTFVFFLDGTKELISKTLLYFNDLLESKGFIRCHKSHLINKIHIDKVLKENQWNINMADGSQVPVSHRKKTTVRNVLT